MVVDGVTVGGADVAAALSGLQRAAAHGATAAGTRDSVSAKCVDSSAWGLTGARQACRLAGAHAAHARRFTRRTAWELVPASHSGLALCRSPGVTPWCRARPLGI